MNRILFAATLAASFQAGSMALAETSPQSMGADARVRSVLYNPVDVVVLDTHLRINTAIELGAGERIDSVLLGDSEAFEVEVLSNRTTVSIKPVIAGAQTNMTIYTSRRTVSFAISEGRTRTPTYRVVLRYPDTSPARPSRVVSGSRDIGYAWSGDDALRPLKVWNDGQATYFAFPANMRPSIFGVDANGYKVTLNSGTRGSVVLVAGLRSAYAIRIGDQVTCIERVAGGVTTSAPEIQALAAMEF